ncbi:hypothetical protein BHM03_00012533 [Ensete ventricosum]|nr:hypothetical protein BHM03_00012533 [Ensete ventricosum]
MAMADALKQFDIFKFDAFEMHFKELNEDGLLISGEEGWHLMLLVSMQDVEKETIDIVPAEVGAVVDRSREGAQHSSEGPIRTEGLVVAMATLNADTFIYDDSMLPWYPQGFRPIRCQVAEMTRRVQGRRNHVIIQPRDPPKRTAMLWNCTL